MYHFIGIKGSGMSGLAVVMKQLGYDVEGSDYGKHFFTEENLISNGINVFEFDSSNIRDDMIIVRGNMFDETNEEVSEAINRNLEIYTYQEMVSKITSCFNLIAVSGCHGKTTTSSLLSHVLDSNYLIGDGSGGIGSNNYFVLEACEYKRHFLNYNPNYVIITNIDLDHVDYYDSIDDVIDAYQEFSDKANIVLACGDCENARKIDSDKIFFYGIGENNYFRAKNIEYYQNGLSFDLYVDNIYEHHFVLPFYGKHMVLNTLAVISVCYLEKIDLDDIYCKLISFKGAKRRFSEVKVLDNVVIDDYAHHPNEIKATIQAARQKYPNKKLVAVFEPHTFSRTLKFCKEIAFELDKSDYVYVMDIYKSRENPEDFNGVDCFLIIDNLKSGEYLKYGDFSGLINHHDSVLLFMSPNDLRNFEEEYIMEYGKRFDKS